MNPPIVINAGGSIFIRETPQVQLMRDFAAILDKFTDHQFYIVIGGGRLARQAISHAKELDADETYLDEIGIEATRLNARVLICAMGDNCYPKPPVTFNEALVGGRSYRYVVMGGTHPGHTTDAVAAMLAERLGAERLIIATNVDGVYTDDPRKNPHAKKLERLTAEDLVKITMRSEAGAGSNSVVDPLASKIIMRSRMPTFVVDGNDLEAVEGAIIGVGSEGTVIIHEHTEDDDHIAALNHGETDSGSECGE